MDPSSLGSGKMGMPQWTVRNLLVASSSMVKYSGCSLLSPSWDLIWRGKSQG